MAINIPNKVIAVTVDTQEGIGSWPYQDGADDPWWYGSADPQDYQWRLTLTIQTQGHSSHRTREPFEYNGYDVSVGNWITNNNTGIALKIISVESKTSTNATVVVEDVVRYNTFRDPLRTGDGSIGVGQAFVFDLSEEGLPLIDPVPNTGISRAFHANLMSRFENFDTQTDFNLTELSTTFDIGDVIAVDVGSNSFVLSDASYSTVIGRVSVLGPGPNDFYINAVQKVHDSFDNLVGDIGDTVYVDSTTPGGLTLDESSGKAVYIKLRNNTQSVAQGLNVNSSTNGNNQLTVNGESVIVPPPGSLVNAAVAIDAVSGTTGVNATVKTLNTIAQTSLSLAYGQVGLYTLPVPPTATIAGTIVTFDIDTVGFAQSGANIAYAPDMAEAINRDLVAALNFNIVADVPANNILRLQHINSGQINVLNGTADVNGTNFAGVNSGSGIRLTTTAETDQVLLLTAQDARAINLRNIVGYPLEDYGIFSSENGVKAAAIYVEQGLRSGVTTVVANIPGRDALSPLVGDQCFVIDAGNLDAEWALYLWDGAAWVTLATADSARTDADSIELTLTFNSATGTIPIGNISTNSRITLTTVEVTTAFDGPATLTIGDSIDNTRILQNYNTDLTIVETFSTQSDHLYGSGSDETINAYFAAGGATQGELRIILSYQ